MSVDVFVSHASADIEKVKEICDELADQDIVVWASFKDIVPGETWDEAIQRALEVSSHVLVIASKNSVNSSYVRAEVEFALDNNKTVIPMLIEEIKLPLRWHTLQYVDYNNDSEMAIKQLGYRLPQNTFKRFEELLSDTKRFNELKQLLYENIDWLDHIHHNSLTTSRWIYPQFAEISKLLSFPKIDFVDNNLLFTEGFRKERMFNTLSNLIVYMKVRNLTNLKVDFVRISTQSSSSNELGIGCFLNPYNSPFIDDITLSAEIREKAEYLKTIVTGFIETPLNVLTGREFVTVSLVAGRRHNYNIEANEAREKFEEDWHESLGASRRYQLNIMSYDRLLDIARRELRKRL